MVDELETLDEVICNTQVLDDGVVVAKEPPVYPEHCFYTTPQEREYYACRPGDRMDMDQYKGWNIMDLSQDSYFITFAGVKRSGKTLLQTFFAMKLMALGNMPCWANYEIKFKVVDRHGAIKEYSSLPLDINALVTMKTVNHGLVVIDEAPLYLGSKQAMTMKNRILSLVMTQMGKAHLSLFMSAQNPKWVDSSVGWQQDCTFYCVDLSKEKPEYNLPRGHIISFKIVDWSGLWTGKSYDNEPILHGPYELKGADTIWPAYKSYEQIDILSAFRPMSLDLRPTVFSDKPRNKIAAQLHQTVGDLIAAGVTRVDSDNLADSLGDVDVNERKIIGSEMRKLGAVRRQSTGGKYFYELGAIQLENGS